MGFWERFHSAYDQAAPASQRYAMERRLMELRDMMQQEQDMRKMGAMETEYDLREQLADYKASLKPKKAQPDLSSPESLRKSITGENFGQVLSLAQQGHPLAMEVLGIPAKEEEAVDPWATFSKEKAAYELGASLENLPTLSRLGITGPPHKGIDIRMDMSGADQKKIADAISAELYPREGQEGSVIPEDLLGRMQPDLWDLQAAAVESTQAVPGRPMAAGALAALRAHPEYQGHEAGQEYPALGEFFDEFERDPETGQWIDKNWMGRQIEAVDHQNLLMRLQKFAADNDMKPVPLSKLESYLKSSYGGRLRLEDLPNILEGRQPTPPEAESRAGTVDPEKIEDDAKKAFDSGRYLRGYY